MGKRIQTEVPTFRYEFSNSDWVEMKASFRLGDRDAINARMVKPKMRVNPETNEEEMTGGVELDTSQANVATLLRAIVAWGGEGFETEGKADPITLDNIAALDEQTAQELLKALNVRNPRAIGPKAGAGKATPATSTSAN